MEDKRDRNVASQARAPASATTDSLYYTRYLDDFRAFPYDNVWSDTVIAGFASDKKYLVETSSAKVVERCLLMSTDPGDLVLDPTCGSGTTAYVAEQWGRRWITIDTSRVALTLARARLMGAKYDYYLLKDSALGATRSRELAAKVPTGGPFKNDIRQGFIYERAPHVTLKSIANNAEIDVIWDRWQATLEPLRAKLNKALKTIVGKNGNARARPTRSGRRWRTALHAQWWEARRKRQEEIDDFIARAADIEFLFTDRPYKRAGWCASPARLRLRAFSPHRVLAGRRRP